MRKETLEGFMFGLAAGFVIAYVLKPPADGSAFKPGDPTENVDLPVHEERPEMPRSQIVTQSETVM